jgi:hypothetical protein
MRRLEDGDRTRKDGGGRRLRRAGGWRRAKAPESEGAAAGLGWGGFGNSGSASVARAHGEQAFKTSFLSTFLHRIESSVIFYFNSFLKLFSQMNHPKKTFLKSAPKTPACAKKPVHIGPLPLIQVDKGCQPL